MYSTIINYIATHIYIYIYACVYMDRPSSSILPA